MKKKSVIVYALVVCFVLVAYFLLFGGSKEETKFTLAEVTKGDLNYVITSSGTLEATSTVDVGTQVSGKIAKLFVDFNSEVKKGQLLAVVDTINLVAQVRDAQSSLAKAEAEYNKTNAIHERNKKLFEKNFISELDFIQSQTDVESAKASLGSAESALERAKTNLSYAYIYAPIAGKIIDRSVEQGQTVAASLSTPTLFTIAEDLSSMRILASVDENDIGQIKEGQKVKFTVQAYSDKTFNGKVTQIRLKPTTSSNVVNYTVVILALNTNKLLLPGMTATIDFYVDNREDVLLIPNSVLRFEPTEEMAEEIKSEMEIEMLSRKDKSKIGAPPQMSPNAKTIAGGSSESVIKSKMRTVFYLDANNKIKMIPVWTGLTDGKNTEIVLSNGLQEGMKLIAGISGKDNITTTTNNSNSLIPSQQMGPPPPMM